MSSNETQSLSQLVSQRMYDLGGDQGPLSLRNVVQRSGDRVGVENLRRIVRGEHQGNISDRIAEGLSVALEVPLRDIYAAIGRPQPKSRWELPAKLDRLNVSQRMVVEDVARAILAAYDQGRQDERQARGGQ